MVTHLARILNRLDGLLAGAIIIRRIDSSLNESTLLLQFLKFLLGHKMIVHAIYFARTNTPRRVRNGKARLVGKLLSQPIKKSAFTHTARTSKDKGSQFFGALHFERKWRARQFYEITGVIENSERGKKNMGGGPTYYFPKWVWSPTGGPYHLDAPHSFRNSCLLFVVVSALTVGIFKWSADHEVNFFCCFWFTRTILTTLTDGSTLEPTI